MSLKSFFSTVKETLKTAIFTRDTFAVFVIAVAGYLIFYAWPYLNQTMTHIPLGVLDLDRTSASRRMINTIESTPTVDLAFVMSDTALAKTALSRNDVPALLIIESDFEKRLSHGDNAPVTLIANGAFPVKGRAIYAAVAAAITNNEKRLSMANVYAPGTPGAILTQQLNKPPELLINYRFNEINGYANYTVPVVSPMILQAVMLMAVTLSVGGWLIRRQRPKVLEDALASPVRAGFPVWMSYWMVAMFWFTYMEGFDFWLYQFGSLEKVGPTFLIGAVYSAAIVSMGFAITFVMGSNRWTCQLVVLTSAPALFISGAVWPAQNLDNPIVAAIAQLFPTTPAIRAIVAVSQDGASYDRLVWPVAQLGLLSLAYLLVTYALIPKYRRAPTQ